MPYDPRTKYDKNVPPNWKPVEALEQRKPGMLFSDKLWHWLVTLGGLTICACGLAVIVFIGFRKVGGMIMMLGLYVIFGIGVPSQAQRNGYRE